MSTNKKQHRQSRRGAAPRRLVLVALALATPALLGLNGTAGVAAMSSHTDQTHTHHKQSHKGSRAVQGTDLAAIKKRNKARLERPRRRATAQRRAHLATFIQTHPGGRPSVTPVVATPSVPPTTAPTSSTPHPTPATAPISSTPHPTPTPSTPTTSAPTTSAPTGTPAPSNTGVQPGTTLTVHDGDINITKAGTVIDRLDVHGAIKVNAPNVTIRNSIIRFRAGGYTVGIQSYSSGLTILDTEIAPTTPSPSYNGLMGYGFTATRLDIHNVIDSVHIYGDNVTLQDSWLHDNVHYADDPNWGGKGSHDDSIQIVKGSNVKILRNNYSGAYNSGIQITQDSGVVSNLTISDNVADGGGCSINVAEKALGPISGLVITGNRFGDHQRLVGCAIIRPETTVATASGNTWLATGATVAIKRG